jgi:hypothetical protein
MVLGVVVEKLARLILVMYEGNWPMNIGIPAMVAPNTNHPDLATLLGRKSH